MGYVPTIVRRHHGSHASVPIKYGRVSCYDIGTGGISIYVKDINSINGLNDDEKEQLSKVVERFPFRTTEYYLSLIDWDDPLDPLRMIAVPTLSELDEWGSLDPSGESEYTVSPRVEHKYEQTAVLLLSGSCASLCRYCFRKRLFMQDYVEGPLDIDSAIDYISRRPEVSNVLITGGDPLMLGTRKLEKVLDRVSEIDHVRLIRIGSKIPAVNPYRITEDPDLLELLDNHITPYRSLYMMTQFNHPRELTAVAAESLHLLKKTGALLNNQTPLLHKVNSNPHTLAELMNELSYMGVAPYYVFQCRPTVGNRHFAVPIEESFRICEEAKNMCSGLGKRFKYAMSHRTGKIEVIDMDDENVYMKYHQAALPENLGRTMALKRNPDALWLEDYTDAE